MARLVLGQAKPSAATLTALYTVPAGKQVAVSTITACNVSSSEDLIRISVAIAGAANADKQYLYYDLPLQGASSERNTFAATLGVSLAATDVVRVYSRDGNTSFNLFGDEA